MVFSQTSLKTQSLLKVVEIDRLKSEKNQQVNDLSGVVTDQSIESTPPSPMATTSFSEVSGDARTEYIKLEEEFKSEMFNEDCEFFQDLQWCPPVEQEALQFIDLKQNEERTLNTDTQHTHFSPQSWDVLDGTMSAQATYNPGFVTPASPNIDDIINIINTQNTHTNKIPFQEQFLDISNLPVVINDIPSENTLNMDPWQAAGSDCQNAYNYTNNTQPFIDQEDSLDAKFVTVTPQEVEANDFFLTEYVINEMDSGGPHTQGNKERHGLSVNVAARSQPWPGDIISTPEVLSCVEQLEKEKCPLLSMEETSPVKDVFVESTSIANSPSVETPPFTPTSEHQIDTDEDVKAKRKRRRHASEDSDDSYTPYTEASPRKYKRRKPSIPIQDMIRVLEGSQQLPKARRGRPPKRRESTVSTVSDNSTVSTHEMKYRELRDKNNEASKRSRMNRKLKELQMEQLADELEERNKKLRVRAELLEDMTKKLREAFMTAVAQKKGS